MTAILVADSSQTVRMDLADTFEAAGFRVFSCATAAQVRTTLRTHPISLAVLDPNLAGDGEALIAQIRNEHVLGELPILVLGDISLPDVECVGKPYDRAHVIVRARELVGAPPLRDTILIIATESSAELIPLLGRAGYTTRVEHTGVAGWEAAIRARPSAIVVGSIPDVDRAAVIRRLRVEPTLRTTPCVGVGAANEEVPTLDAGADAFVKGGDPELVLARLRALLRSQMSGVIENAGVLPRVLIADDDPDYLDLLASRLRKRGYDVFAQPSGVQGIEVLAGQPIDCIVLDRAMPGLSGIETCERIKAEPSTREIPVIIMTSSERRDSVIESLSAGADDFVSKAAGFDALAARIQAQLRRRQHESEQRDAREQVLRGELALLEARTARELAEVRAAAADQLAHSNRELVALNRELEGFAYAVAHDLRTPLRMLAMSAHAIAMRSTDELAIDHARRQLAATNRMSELIDALLELGRVQGVRVARHTVDLTAVATAVIDDLERRDPSRRVEHAVARGLVVDADGRLVRVLLENLVRNAWRFTSPQRVAHVEVGCEQTDKERVFYVKDDGVGFATDAAPRIFATGIGLATARKIVEHHGGRIWAEGAPGAGAKFSFTLP